MKKTILIVALVVASIVALSSMTYGEAARAGYKVTFTVPATPKSTIVTDGLHVKEYLKKGYQIQNAWYNNNTYENMYVIVKY